MKNIWTFSLLVSFAFNCGSPAPPSQQPTPVNQLDSSLSTAPIEQDTTPISPFDTVQHLISYNNLKSKIDQKRSYLARRTDIDSTQKLIVAKEYFTTMLIDSVFEYWEGTTWDFNGYTATPRKGEIACGYYISTTLRDMGINLNRYKVAQQAAAVIVERVCEPSSIITLNGYEAFSQYYPTIEEGELLVVGLSNHVGFLYKQNGQCYFAHSNYRGKVAVEKEKAETSAALKASLIYVVGSITKNDYMFKKWLFS